MSPTNSCSWTETHIPPPPSQQLIWDSITHSLTACKDKPCVYFTTLKLDSVSLYDAQPFTVGQGTRKHYTRRVFTSLSTNMKPFLVYNHQLTSELSCGRPEHSWSTSFITAAFVMGHTTIYSNGRPYLASKNTFGAGEQKIVYTVNTKQPKATWGQYKISNTWRDRDIERRSRS